MDSRRLTPWFVGMVFVLVAGLGSTPAVEAVPSLVFDQNNQGGSIAYPVVGGALIGTDIVFEFFAAIGTGADGFYQCSNCTLDFVTGPAIGPDLDGPIYQFGGGGSFILTGGVPAMAIADGSVLLAGNWTGVPVNIAVAIGTVINFVGNGLDFKNPDLAAFLGISPFDWRYANSEFNLGTATVNADGTFFGAVEQADLRNTQNLEVPEPGSSLLLLLGLGSLAAYRRRS